MTESIRGAYQRSRTTLELDRPLPAVACGQRMAVVATTRDLEAERARLRQRLAKLRREKALVERELARLEAEINGEPVPHTRSGQIPETAIRQPPRHARAPATARTELPSDPARLAATARQAFGGEPFTVRELLVYLKQPQHQEARIEELLRSAVHAGLLAAGPRFGASSSCIEYSSAAIPGEPRQLRLSVVVPEVDDTDMPAVDDADMPANHSQAPDPRKRKPLRSTPLPPVRLTSLAAAQRAWDEQQQREREPEAATVNRGTPIRGTGRDVLAGLPPDVRRLVQPAVSAGWTARRANGSHIQFTDPSDPSRRIVVSGSPSDRRALERIRGDLRRHGLLSRA